MLGCSVSLTAVLQRHSAGIMTERVTLTQGAALVQHVHKPDDMYFGLSSILFLDKIKYQNFWSLTSDPDCPKMAKLKA